MIEELERLVDKLHEREHNKKPRITRHDTNVKLPEEKECDRCLFGNHVKERYDARKLVDYVNYTVPWQHSNPRAAAAVFARYSNLLEHVVTLCDFAQSSKAAPPSSTSPSLALPTIAIQATASSTTASEPGVAKKLPLLTPPAANSASNLAHHHTVHALLPNNPVDLLFKCTCTHLRSSYSAIFQEPNALETHPNAKLLHTQDLGKTLAGIIDEKILSDVSEIAKKPFTPEEGAFIVRCILAAWSWQVLHITLIESDTGDGGSNASKEEANSSANDRSRIAGIDELLPVLVFG